MVDEVDETVRAAFADTYNKGYADGYAAGVAAALEKIQSLATEDSVPVQSRGPSMRVSVAALGLKKRVSNTLSVKGIHTVEGIYGLSEEPFGIEHELMKLPNLGPLGVNQIRRKLIEFGYPEI